MFGFILTIPILRSNHLMNLLQFHLRSAQGDLVVAFVDGEFTLKQIDFSHREEGYILLHPANPNYKDIRIEGDETFEVWGVVIWTIRSWRK